MDLGAWCNWSSDAIVLDASAKRKVSALIEQGQIRDERGTTDELAESRGWEVVLA
jgi:hypothetical protein